MFGDIDFMRFENPLALALIVILILIIIAGVIVRKRLKKNLSLLINDENRNVMFPFLSKENWILKTLFWTFGLLFLILAAANLQLGSDKRTMEQEGIDLIFCLDVSKSMLAEDITPNRLERAKYSIQKIVNQLASDRIGIIVFAGDAYVQLPLTTDHSAINLYLQSINAGMLPSQGTSIASAIEKAYESLPKNKADNKAIIIITDGENHDEEALQLAKQHDEHNVRIFTVGIGSTEGVMLPEYVNGKKVGFKKDKNGSVVVSRINESLLVDIARNGGGEYVKATSSSVGLDILMNKIKSIDKVKMGVSEYQSYLSYYHYFLVIGLLFLIVEQLLIGCRWSELQ